MNKKISLGMAISLMAIAATIAISMTYMIAINIFENRMSSITQRQATDELIVEIDNKIRQKYNGEIAESTLRDGIAKGYVDGLDNENCSYMSANEWELETSRQAGYDFGLGMKLSKSADKNIQVNRVTAGSPADKAGIKRGDIITYVNSVSVLSMGYEKAVDIMGKESEVTVYVVGNNKSYKLIKTQYEIVSVEYKTISEIGYININQFNEKTPGQFNSALNKLRQKDMTALIIDLRDSQGGSYEYACDILDTLLPACRLMTFTDKTGDTKDMYKSDKACLSVPMCVLINENTSGASELFASAMFDCGCDLIGTKTKGLLDVQEYFELSDGSALCLTTGRWNTASDRARRDGAIVPSFEVELTSYQKENFYLLNTEDDPQLTTALERARALAEANIIAAPPHAASDADAQ